MGPRAPAQVFGHEEEEIFTGEFTDKLDAAGNTIAGNVKEAAGKLTGSDKLQAEGEAQKVKGTRRTLRAASWARSATTSECERDGAMLSLLLRSRRSMNKTSNFVVAMSTFGLAACDSRSRMLMRWTSKRSWYVIRDHRWEDTSLGPLRSWPQPLRTLVRVMFRASRSTFIERVSPPHRDHRVAGSWEACLPLPIFLSGGNASCHGAARLI